MNKEQERQRIGRRIATIRKAIEWIDESGIKRTGMTQAELANRIGLSQVNIARIERGYYSAGFDQLQAISEGLGGKIDIIF